LISEISTTKKLLDHLESLGSNENLSHEMLLKKSLILMAISSKKLPEEISRTGRSNLITSKEDRIGFKLQKEGNWGGTTFLMQNKDRPSVCPVLCLKAYLQKIEPFPLKEEENLTEKDRLFLSPQDQSVLTPEKISELIQSVLKDSGYDMECSPVKSVFEKRTKEIDFQGSKFFTCSNLLLSYYNKVEALKWWIEQKKLNPKRIVFVDDNSDNAYSMYLHFSQKESPCVHSFWYVPPHTGRDEKNIEEARAIFKYIAEQQLQQRTKEQIKN